MISNAGRLLVIGGGNMGSAIVRGVIAGGEAAATDVCVIEPDASRRRALAALGVVCVADGARMKVAWGAEAVLIAVKPQLFTRVAPVVAGAAATGSLVVSIMAGVSIAAIERVLRAQHGQRPLRIVRVMPNLAVQVGKGACAMFANARTTHQDRALVFLLFAALGEVYEMAEKRMNAFTALAGSGPAYLFYLAQALQTAGVKAGFKKADARAIVRQTLVGAAELLRKNPTSFEDLRARVTSKGGTTAAATAVLDKSGVMDAFVRAVVAARDRGAELSRLAEDEQ